MRPSSVHFISRLAGTGPKVLVSGMPAWECPECGEQVTDAPIFEAVTRLLGPSTAPRRRAVAGLGGF